MPITLAIALFAAIGLQQLPQQLPCTPGRVTEVSRGKDYIITVCGVGPIGLRGVEPPIRSPELFGDILGQKDIGPEALQFLSTLLVGQRVTLTYDGYRMGDFVGRRYAYVYLPDKRFVNAELISRGLGYADRQGSHPMRDQFLALEAKARQAKVGVWS